MIVLIPLNRFDPVIRKSFALMGTVAAHEVVSLLVGPLRSYPGDVKRTLESSVAAVDATESVPDASREPGPGLSW